MNKNEVQNFPNDIAIIGISGRFPGARNIGEFWQNLCDGVESISFFSEREMEEAGVDPALMKDPAYVNAGGVLEDIDMFDASFFGFSPREAETMDPQHRVFMECTWEALEESGYDPETFVGLIGVYAGSAMSTYLLNNIQSNLEIIRSVGSFQIMLGNDKDHLPTRTSYKLNLKGPSINVQTACSTSLVAVGLACESLLSFQCDIAVAGGVGIRVPQKAGYFYQYGGVSSPDGHCRAFDADAQGTVGGNGAGVVVLRRLSDALADGDQIHAVIKGSAINNDGSLKVGYTAPSLDGQAEVIALAQSIAGVEPETISYVEAHGTGTAMGDPIEIAALTQVFRSSTERKSFCAIGSVKTNVGHLDPAAGVAGLIKTVLMLKHKLLPPSLHYKQPNREIDFSNSSFYVNTKLRKWDTNGLPRRAAVSSFGIGGTNAHVILEEAQPLETRDGGGLCQLLTLSAKTKSALETMTTDLVEHLKQNPTLNLGDVTYTYHVGRRAFDYRRAVVCHHVEDAINSLGTLAPGKAFDGILESQNSEIVFMFSGQGSQYVNMGRGLYQAELTFREQVDNCAELLRSHLGFDLRAALFPDSEDNEASDVLKQTAVSQPALFVLEYALAKLWMFWGVRPSAMIGHSIGEYVAACLAGVFSLEEALMLVAHRGRLMQQMDQGSMLVVPLPETEAISLLNERISLAAVNGPSICVVAGPTDDINQLEKQLADTNINCRRLRTSHAFHSSMMEPMLEPFKEIVGHLQLGSPQLRYISNVSGTWINSEEARNPDYWASHVRRAVRFYDGLQNVETDNAILLEVGPGQQLSTLARQCHNRKTKSVVLPTLRDPNSTHADRDLILQTLGRLWLAGVPVDWHAFHANATRHRVTLPTYPFERQRYWIEPKKFAPVTGRGVNASIRKADIADWFYVPAWKTTPPRVLSAQALQKMQSSHWLVFANPDGPGSVVAERLKQRGYEVSTVIPGEYFARRSDGVYIINSAQEDYDALVAALQAEGKTPERILHLWNVSNEQVETTDESVRESQRLGFYSLLFLAQSLARHKVSSSIQLDVISNRLHALSGTETPIPAKATLLGACKVIPQEHSNIRCRSIDFEPHDDDHAASDQLLDLILMELGDDSTDTVVAYRQEQRFVQTFEPIRLERDIATPPRLRQNGVYLITGGLGRLGLLLAEYLAYSVRARIILCGRTGLPPREAWIQWLMSHDAQDVISSKIRRLQAIEAMGSPVMILGADAANEREMEYVVNQAYWQFGALHGVIHAAATTAPASFAPVVQMNEEVCESQFHPKIYGLLNLEKVLRGKYLDFCMVFSSMASILGGLSFAAYSAANCFLDAFVEKMRVAQSVPWTSVNWDGWQVEPASGNGNSSTADLAIRPEEGMEALMRILARPHLYRVAVSVADLNVRMNQWIRLGPTGSVSVQQSIQPSTQHARPNNVSSSYVAPRNETERSIVEIWQVLLGVTEIGIHDNFLELGGHSLLAIQLASRLRDSFALVVPLQTIFAKPTVAELAAFIDDGSDQANTDLLQEKLRLVEELSDEEVRLLLAE